jgi:7-keto-8-aminopelargonate synthetase-like enzyme
MRVYPHNTLAKLERLLGEAPEGQMQVVLTESIFSMDGDAGDLRGLAELRDRFGFVLVLDEAHGSGVYGPGGAGYAAELGLGSAVDVTVVTLSKAIGSAGGAVCASANFCAAVLNHGRAYVYSTHVTPATAAWATEAVAVMADEPALQRRVRELSRVVRAEVGRMGFDVPAGDSPIVPVILGDEAAALAAADRLLEAGLLVPAVRPPTVPRGGSRLRVTLSAAHSDEEVGRLVDALRGIVSLH